MKNYILSLLFIITIVNLRSQVNLQFKKTATSPAENFNMIHVNSDFGRRSGDGVSKWHRGIDLNPSAISGIEDKGFHLITPVNGTVTQLNGTGHYFYIIIKDDNQTNGFDFGYGHIFEESDFPIELNGMVFAKLENSTSDFAIIDIANNRAISDIDGGAVKYKGFIIPTTNKVKAGWTIGILGDSDAKDAKGNYVPHLHLYRPENPGQNEDPQDINNAKDPMQILNFDNTDFNISINGIWRITEASQNTYYDGSAESVIKVKVEMDNPEKEAHGSDTHYKKSVMNIDDVFLKIKKSNEPDASYRLLEGSQFFTLISHGAKTGYVNGENVRSIRYPSNGVPIGNTFDIANNPGVFPTTTSTASRMGIIPTAYGSGGNAGVDGYDEFVFSKIYTRIHKNNEFGTGTPELAKTNQNARYPDGNYHLYAGANTVKGYGYPKQYPSEPVEIKIDNFKPYVRKIEVLSSWGIPVYQGEWNENGNNITYNESVNTPIEKNFPVIINIWPSEEMKNLNVSSDQYDLSGSLIYHNGIWSCAANLEDIDNISVFEIEITGKDIKGNDLIHINHSEGNSVACNTLYRGADGKFPGTYTSGESFSLDVCSSLKSTSIACYVPTYEDDVSISNFDYAIGGINNNEIYFANHSMNADYCYWDFGDGEVSTSCNPGTHTYPLEPHTKAYTIILRTTNLDGETSESLKRVSIPGTEDDANIYVTVDVRLWDCIEDYFEEYCNPDVISKEFHIELSNIKPDHNYEVNISYGDGHTGSLWYDMDDQDNWTLHCYKIDYFTATYYPELMITEIKDEEVIAEYTHQIDPITIYAKPIEDIDIDFKIETDNEYNAISPGDNFKLTATVTKGRPKYFFQWSIYPNETSSGSPEIINSSSIDKIDELIWSFLEKGQYLISLFVTDQYGNQGQRNFVATVTEKAGCANLTIHTNCPNIKDIPMGREIQFYLEHNGLDCAGDYIIGMIEWYLNGEKVKSACNTVSLPEFGYCYTFNTPGKNFLMVKVYPIIEENMIDLGNPTIIWKIIDVTDCGSIHNINSDNELHEDMSPNYGYINICNEPESSVTVGSGEDFRAYANRIKLLSGFSAKMNSQFTATIGSCNDENCTCSGDIYYGDCSEVEYYDPDATGHIDLYVRSVDQGPYHGEIELWFERDWPNPTYCTIGLWHQDNYGTYWGEKNYEGLWENVRDGQRVSFGYEDWTARKLIADVRSNPLGTPLDIKEIWVGGLFTQYSANEKINNDLDNKNLVAKLSNDLVIYPNPTNGVVNVYLDNNLEEIQFIEVYNYQGQLVFQKIPQKLPEEIDLSSCSQGLFYVRVILNDNSVKTGKVILKK